MELLPDGTRKIAIGKEQFDSINNVLASFYKQTKCGVIMLSDVSGLAVALKGTRDKQAMSLLSTLAAGNYAATAEIARLLDEESSFKGQFHEGKSQSIYLKGIDDDFFLTIVFGKNITFGMVRVLAEKVIEELACILKSSPLANSSTAQHEQQQELNSQAKNDLADQGFQEELSSRLDAILGKF